MLMLISVGWLPITSTLLFTLPITYNLFGYFLNKIFILFKTSQWFNEPWDTVTNSEKFVEFKNSLIHSNFHLTNNYASCKDWVIRYQVLCVHTNYHNVEFRTAKYHTKLFPESWDMFSFATLQFLEKNYNLDYFATTLMRSRFEVGYVFTRPGHVTWVMFPLYYNHYLVGRVS